MATEGLGCAGRRSARSALARADAGTRLPPPFPLRQAAGVEGRGVCLLLRDEALEGPGGEELLADANTLLNAGDVEGGQLPT